jgi:UPF0716 family protein affecting phage T7 exclusion
MEQMQRRIWLAALLGILIGVTLGYTPHVSPIAAPRTELFMQQTRQPNVAQATPQPTSDALSILIALAAGLVIAIPAFAFAKRRSG